MLRNKQMADIIDAARNSPAYLVSDNWLCTVIDTQKGLFGISQTDVFQICKRINRTLNSCSFLRVYLKRKKLISDNCTYSSPEYRKAAQAHWDKLVAKLRE